MKIELTKEEIIAIRKALSLSEFTDLCADDETMETKLYKKFVDLSNQE